MPNVVVFLGDLLDEGSIASAEEYQRYVGRFWSIFSVPRNTKVREAQSGLWVGFLARLLMDWCFFEVCSRTEKNNHKLGCHK